MPTPDRPRQVTVVYDPDAAAEFATAIKSKEERRAMLNAIDKLRELGDRLAPPHMKPLQGQLVVGLCELRPRQGRSDWRAVYRRFGTTYVVLGFDRHENFDALIARARARVSQYVGPPLEKR